MKFVVDSKTVGLKTKLFVGTFVLANAPAASALAMHARHPGY